MLPRPSSEHALLAAFVGRWRQEGESYAEGQTPADPRGSRAPWVSDESYEWVPGGFFLLHRWSARVGAGAFEGVEIIGYDDSSHAYFAHNFTNHGFRPSYQARVEGNLWTFDGEAQRAQIAFESAGDSMTIRWEWRPDGSLWLPLCDRTAKRA